MADIEKYYRVVENRGGVWMADGSIAYLSDQSGTSQIWTLSLEDREPRQLTFYGERIWRLAPTGDRKGLLFASDLGGNEQEQIYLLRQGESEARDLSGDGTSRFYLGGTDSACQWLYYACNQRSKASFDICRKNIGTGEARIVLENHDNYNLPASVSPDGRYMLYNKLKGMSDNRMYLADMEQGTSRDLKPGGSNAQYESTAWRSDSKGFYVTTDEDSEFLYVAYYDVASGSLTKVYETDWSMTAFRFSRRAASVWVKGMLPRLIMSS